MAPVRARTPWGNPGPGPGPGPGPADLRWPRRCVSVPCAVTTPLGTTTGCGPVRAARLFLRGASRVRVCGQMDVKFLVLLQFSCHIFHCEINKKL